MRYLIAAILCLLATTAEARHRKVPHDMFGNPVAVQRVVHHVVHHRHHRTHHHHVRHTSVSVPALARPDGRRDYVFRIGSEPIGYPYATGTAILDAYSGRIPVTYCAPKYAWSNQ